MLFLADCRVYWEMCLIYILSPPYCWPCTLLPATESPTVRNIKKSPFTIYSVGYHESALKMHYYYDSDWLWKFQTELHFMYVSEIVKYIFLPTFSFPRWSSVGRLVELSICRPPSWIAFLRTLSALTLYPPVLRIHFLTRCVNLLDLQTAETER